MTKELLVKIKTADGQVFYAVPPDELVKDQGGTIIFNYGAEPPNSQLPMGGVFASEITGTDELKYADLTQEFPEFIIIRRLNVSPPAPVRATHDPSLTRGLHMSEDVK